MGQPVSIRLPDELREAVAIRLFCRQRLQHRYARSFALAAIRLQLRQLRFHLVGACRAVAVGIHRANGLRRACNPRWREQ